MSENLEQESALIIRLFDEDFFNFVFGIGEESLSVELPERLQKMRKFEKTKTGRSLSEGELFAYQAEKLWDYEDDYDGKFFKSMYRYSNYRELGDASLRAYFSWRTKWRKGIYEALSDSFAMVYLSELVNLTGGLMAGEAFSMIKEFKEEYCKLNPDLQEIMEKVMMEFIVYYDLDPSLFESDQLTSESEVVRVLLNVKSCKNKEIFEAVKKISGTALQKSIFCKKKPEIMEFVVAEVLKGMIDHYSSMCKSSWSDRYLGQFRLRVISLLENVTFDVQAPRENREVKFFHYRKYFFMKGNWRLEDFVISDGNLSYLKDVLKTIDAVARERTGFPAKIKRRVDTKWIIKLIEDKVANWKEAKKLAEKRKIKIDVSKLGKIRSDSDVTREKLLTEEEMAVEVVENTLDSFAVPSNDDSGFDSLSEQEKRYLQCLIKGTSVKWVSEEGLLPSLLCDCINDKLYDLFEDTVLENGSLVEDYTEELRKGLCI